MSNLMKIKIKIKTGWSKYQLTLLFITFFCVTTVVFNIAAVVSMNITNYSATLPTISIIKDDTLSLTFLQSIINSYITQLSQSDYSHVKPNIIIEGRFMRFTFPHLTVNSMISTFSNQNIWIAGDSTVENLFVYLLWLFTEYKANQTLEQLSFDYDLTLVRNNFPARFGIQPYANDKYYKTTNISISTHDDMLIYKHFNDYNLTFYGGKVQKCAYYPSANAIDQLQTRIDIIISNFDLLFCLHIMNPFTKERLHKIPAETLQANLQFENKLESFVNNSINSGVKCLIFYGANTVDDSKYYGNWKHLVEVWSQKKLNEKLLNSCLKAIQHRHDPDHVLVNLTHTTGFVMTAFDLCKQSVLMSTGAYWSSERLYSWIQWKQKQLDMKGNNATKFKLLYFNQTQLTDNRGNYTSDGRHYSDIVPVKTEAVTNIISKFCRYIT